MKTVNRRKFIYSAALVEKMVCLTRRYRFPLTHIWIDSQIISGSAWTEISGSRTPKNPYYH